MQNKHGGTESQHIQALRKMGAKLPEREEPVLPESMTYLWELHKDVRFSIVPHEDEFLPFQRDPITYQSLSAYFNCTGIQLNNSEISVIMSIDSIFNKYRG